MEPLEQINSVTGICFYKVTAPVDLTLFLRERGYADVDIAHWLEFGCIYIDGRRQRQPATFAPGQVLRLHTRPKRFLTPENLRAHILAEEDEFLILDKPAGLPTHPTLDNYLENAKVRLERELARPLYTTHRLDVPTQGLLILAKTPDAQRLINKMFARGRVGKTYRALNQGRVEPGEYTHFMDPESRVPKAVRLEKHEDWWECRLRVDRRKGQAHEITLLTGRTHQIRAQMAALGAPIVGDVVYGAGGEKTVRERIELECFRLSFSFRSRTFNFARCESIVPW